MTEDGDRFLARLELVTVRLQKHAASPPAPGLTEPDPSTGERWDWGQVWAHLAEFVPYWMEQARLVLRSRGSDPIPFGRTKSDPDRIAAIDRDRHVPATELWERLKGHVSQLWTFIDQIPPKGWTQRGVHSTLGEMDTAHIVEEFLVGHLEAHADQLDQLAAGRGEGIEH